MNPTKGSGEYPPQVLFCSFPSCSQVGGAAALSSLPEGFPFAGLFPLLCWEVRGRSAAEWEKGMQGYVSEQCLGMCTSNPMSKENKNLTACLK